MVFREEGQRFESWQESVLMKTVSEPQLVKEQCLMPTCLVSGIKIFRWKMCYSEKWLTFLIGMTLYQYMFIIIWIGCVTWETNDIMLWKNYYWIGNFWISSHIVIVFFLHKLCCKWRSNLVNTDFHYTGASSKGSI